MKSVKAIVVDDHPLMAQATVSILERMECIQVVGVAYNGQSCLELAELFDPDLILLDYQLPDQSGVELAASLREAVPRAQIVVFTGVDVADLIHPLLEHHVSGIISKEMSESTFKHMLACVLEGHVVLPREHFYKMKLPAAAALPSFDLTDEEVLIMSMVVKGATYENIAETIHVSKRSIDNYLRKIYDKLGVQNRLQAIEKFVQSRYYESDSVGGTA